MSGFDHVDAGMWQQLHDRQRELRLAVGREPDPARRAELQHELVEVRLAISQLEDQVVSGPGDAEAPPKPAPAVTPPPAPTSPAVAQARRFEPARFDHEIESLLEPLPGDQPEGGDPVPVDDSHRVAPSHRDAPLAGEPTSRRRFRGGWAASADPGDEGGDHPATAPEPDGPAAIPAWRSVPAAPAGTSSSGAPAPAVIRAGLFQWSPPVAALAAVVLALNVAYNLSLLLVKRPDGYTTLWEGWVYPLAGFTPAVLVGLRAWWDDRFRVAWSLLALGMVLNATGDMIFNHHDRNLDRFPAPSDVPYLASYLAFAVALALVTQAGTRRGAAVLRLDGLVVGLAAASVATAVWFQTILDQSGSHSAVVVSLAYPLFDLVFIVIAVSALAPARYRPTPSALAFIAGALWFAVGDIVYLRQVAAGTYRAGTILEATWLIGVMLFSLAPWLRPLRRRVPSARMSLAGTLVPLVAAASALGVIAWGTGHDVPALAVLLAVAAIVAGFVRVALTMVELRRQAEEGPTRRAAAAAPTAPARAAGQPIWLAALTAVAITGFLGVGVLSWQLASDRSGGSSTAAGSSTGRATEASQGADSALSAGVGANPAGPSRQDATVQASAVGTAASSQAPSDPQAVVLQRKLDRLLASTPILFQKGQSQLSELQQRLLNNVAATLLASPGTPVDVIGFTDSSGSAESNLALSSARAGAVRDYLAAHGVPSSSMTVVGRGSATAGSNGDLAGLERRVEIKVSSGPRKPRKLRVGLVAPGARNDQSFTQSMVDALNTMALERTDLQLTITDNTFVPDDVEAALRTMAAQHYDLIIAHGPQFGPIVIKMAAEYPDVLFAWGTASTPNALPNLYTYSARAEEGGYVLGWTAAMISSSQVMGVVAPAEVSDDQRYVNGFRAGVAAGRPGANVFVDYTGSFSDTSLAADQARAQVQAGADQLTGTDQMSVGAVEVASERNVRWYGNQSNQAKLAPQQVVASQVYHWEVLLRPMLADVDNGARNGRPLELGLANGGLVIEYNPAVSLPPDVLTRGRALATLILGGSLRPLG